MGTRVVDYLEQLPHLKWLALGAVCLSATLLLVLIWVCVRYIGLRRRLAERPEPAGPGFVYSALPSWEELGPPISLEGEGRALIDRIFPRRPREFLFVVAVLAVGCWAAGVSLAEDVHAFVTTPEWQLQPLYLAAHFITLRLFATMFTRNFMAGIAYLDMPPSKARHAIWLVLGPLGALAAVVIATPFCLYDYKAFYVDNAKPGGMSRLDQLLLGIWCVEWFLIAFIWVQLVGFLLLTRWAIREHNFRAPIEVVLHERQYRPFLQMSVQGATIVLGFFIVNAAYTWYTDAKLGDYIGVGVTLLLLVVGFIPPWVLLTAKVDRAVNAEMVSLRQRLADTGLRGEPLAGIAGAPRSGKEVEQRLDEALVMLRISYLERLYRDLGNIEATSVMMRVGVPAVTIGYYILKYLRG